MRWGRLAAWLDGGVSRKPAPTMAPMLAIVLILSLIAGGCQQVETIADIAPRAVLPGGGAAASAGPLAQAGAGPGPAGGGTRSASRAVSRR